MIIRELRDDSRLHSLMINKEGRLIMPYKREVIGVCFSEMFNRILFKTRPSKEEEAK